MRFDGCGTRMSQAGYFSEFVKGDRHGRACLPVLELRQRSVCFGRGECWERWVLESLLREGVFLSHPINSWGCRRSGGGDGIIGK